MKIALGLLLGLMIGVISRVTGLPLPAPPVLVVALLVVSMTLGYVVVDRLASHRKASAKPLCGGPTGAAADREER
jgi:XapX domain-containing protein